MLAHYEVHMIGQDRACIARVTMPGDRIREPDGDFYDLFYIKTDDAESESLFRRVVELANDMTRRLHSASPVMSLAQFRKRWRRHRERAAPTWIIGQPRPICRPNQMMGDQTLLPHRQFRAPC